MRLDLWMATASPFATAEVLATVGAEAEARGYGGIWVPEHVVLFDDYASAYPYAEDGRMPAPPGTGMLEPLTTLSFLAACTSTVRLGTGIMLLPQRNPVYAAKEVATLDWLSNGRADLGVGVGWLKEEFDALGVPWPRRGARTDEYLDVLSTLWCDDPSSFDGVVTSLPPCSMFPKPVQSPHPPVYIGGESDAALARTARAGQGWLTFGRTPDEVAAPLARLTELLEAEGRSRDEVTVTVCPYFAPLDADILEAYRRAGADAVAALLVPLDVDTVRQGLDGLQPVLDRAATL